MIYKIFFDFKFWEKLLAEKVYTPLKCIYKRRKKIKNRKERKPKKKVKKQKLSINEKATSFAFSVELYADSLNKFFGLPLLSHCPRPGDTKQIKSLLHQNWVLILQILLVSSLAPEFLKRSSSASRVVMCWSG